MTDARGRVRRAPTPAARSATAPKAAEQGKLFARDRIARLVDPGSFLEDAGLANPDAGDSPPTAS